MGQRDRYIYGKMVERQDALIRELQHNIALLEEQNDLQKELIGHLQKENRILQGHLEDYAGVVRQMMDGTGGQEG